MQPGLTTFEVTVDAGTAAEFREALDRLALHGTTVSTAQPLATGTVCGLRVVSRSGAFSALGEGSVVTLLKGQAPRAVVRPTVFGAVATSGQVPTGESLEDPTAATPVGWPVAPDPDLAAPPESKPAEHPELPAFSVLGNYQMLKHLGGGGMAEVYLARSVLGQGVDKVVALKTVRAAFGPETRYGSMFLNEARVTATLQHPNLVQVFDFGEAAGRPYLAMEHVHGRDLGAVLERLIAQRTPASAAIAVSIGIKICQALEYVHGTRDLDGRPLNLVHRDVSPSNVLVTARGELKLMDFGVAAADLGATDTAGMLVGKLSHMPPEQLKGGAAAASWDLYPVGVTLYQLLTLSHPWKGNPRQYLLMPALRLARPAPSKVNSSVPPELDALLARATQLEAPARHQTAKALREELEAVQKLTGPGDIGAWVESMFGPALVEEDHQLEALTAEGRRKAERSLPAFLLPLARPLSAAKRRLVYSRPYRAIARRPWLARALLAAVALAVLGGGGGGAWVARERGLVREQLFRADAQLLAGRLTGQGSDDALDVLLAGQRRWPGEPRIARRLALLAQRFEALGTLAIERDNQEEAAAHLEAALQAEPGRASAKKKLVAVEEAVRARARDKMVQSQ